MDKYANYRRLLTAAILIGLLIVVLKVKLSHVVLGFNYNTYGLAGIIGTATFIEWYLFNKYLWKLPFLQGWLVYIPNLNGSWTGIIQSTYKVNGKTIAPIGIEANIYQTLSSITIDFTSNEMVSKSIVAQIGCDPIRRTNEIFYTYQSVPDATVRHRSPINYGSANLAVKSNKQGIRLEGNYWTDRNTQGTISLKRAI